MAGFIGSANLLPGEVVGTDGDDTVVDLVAGHTVRTRTNVQRAPGTRVSVMLRPERLTATDAAGDDGRSIEGTVVDVVFQGATTHVVVHLHDQSEVIASVVTGTNLPFLHPGSTVHLSWDPGSAFMLSDWPLRPGATASDIETLEKNADS